MEDWTQVRHPVLGAKLSRLQTLSARASKQTTQIWRNQKLLFCTKQSSFCSQIFSPLSLIEFRHKLVQKVRVIRFFVCMQQSLFKLHSCFTMLSLQKPTLNMRVCRAWELFWPLNLIIFFSGSVNYHGKVWIRSSPFFLVGLVHLCKSNSWLIFHNAIQVKTLCENQHQA